MFWVCRHECGQLYLSCDYWSISATWWRDRHIITAFKSTLQNQQFNNSYISTKPQNFQIFFRCTILHPNWSLEAAGGWLMEPSPAVALHWKQLEMETPYLWLKDFEQYILSTPDPTNCELRQNRQIRTIWWIGWLWQAIEGSEWLQARALCKVEDFVNLAIIKLCCRVQWVLRVWQFYFQLAYILIPPSQCFGSWISHWTL